MIVRSFLLSAKVLGWAEQATRVGIGGTCFGDMRFPYSAFVTVEGRRTF
jgi:hypothetical protein